jgi:phosphoserine phosphatase RsbU/P
MFKIPILWELFFLEKDLKKPTILIIDDEKIITESLHEVIDKYFDFNVIESNDPEEAFSILEKSQSKFSFIKKNKIDCIICDIKMPNINGINLIKRWRKKEKKKHIPVVLLSAYEDIEKWSEATHPYRFFVSAYLKKPINNEQIKNILQKIIIENKSSELIEETRKVSYEKYFEIKNTKELKKAKEIQMSVLPKYSPQIDSLKIDAFFKSANFIGGDFYDYVYDGKKLAIIVVDIIGKGIPACLMMVRVREIFHRYFDVNLKPKDFVTLLNSKIYNEPTFKTGAPLFYGCFDLQHKTFTYVNTLGNAGGIHFSSDTSNILSKGGFMAGADENEIYEEETIHYKKGDFFSFFTDGITEQQNIDKTQLDITGVQKFIENYISSSKSKSFHSYLIDSFNQFMNGSKQNDDLTIINIEVVK